MTINKTSLVRALSSNFAGNFDILFNEHQGKKGTVEVNFKGEKRATVRAKEDGTFTTAYKTETGFMADLLMKKLNETASKKVRYIRTNHKSLTDVVAEIAKVYA